MAIAAKRNLKSQSPETQLELVYSYNHNPYWQSSLFNEVYLQNDVPLKYKEIWELDEAGPFYLFCNQFRNLCEELKDAELDSWSERNTINRLIKPILRMLGYADKCSATQEPWAEDESFTVREQGDLKVYKPDFIVVDDPKELKYIEKLKTDEKVQEARASVLIPIEAKYWGRLDELRMSTPESTKRSDKKDQADATRALDFEDQCLKYMEILNNDYGILTDGKTWRLYSRELSSGNFKRNFQFNLGHLIRHVNAGLDRDDADYKVFIENAKYFFHIFGKAAVQPKEDAPRFLDDLLQYSKKYVSKIEDDLKDRFVKAMSIACNGYYRSAKSVGETVELETIRTICESQLFNILFIRYCESRGILPVRQSPTYRRMSLSNILDKLEYFNPAKEQDDLNLLPLRRVFAKDFDYKHDGTELYERLLGLTKVIQNGTGNLPTEFEIVGFKESIFSSTEWKFVQRLKITNRDMVRILFELGFTKSDIAGQKWQQIPFNFFSPRQLGSIYESFLEFKIEKATEDLLWQKKQWQPAKLDSAKVKALDAPKVKKGDLYFTPDNVDRKASGSYYTPDDIVRMIVSQTLNPSLQKTKSKDILKLRVCDPAMGSGHFLAGCLTYLAEQYLERVESETNDDLQISLVQAKQLVLHNCIYGVDLNERAVKLAKMSLWLESASAGQKLEDLDDQLKCGDSISGAFNWQREFSFIESDGGFDAIVGNPPWGAKIEKVGNLIRDSKVTFPRVQESFSYFMVLACALAKKKARVGLIVPSVILYQSDFADLRRYLSSEEASPDLIADLGDGRFEGVIASAAVLILGRSAQATEYRAYDFKKGRAIDLENPGIVPLEEISEATQYVMPTRYSTADVAALAALRSPRTLDSEIELLNCGVSTGGDKAFVDGVRAAKLPKKRLHRAVRGRNVHPFRIEYGNDLMLYTPRGDYKLEKEYLNYLEEFKPSLAKRSEAKKGMYPWWQMNRPRDVSYFEKPKILLRQTGDSLVAAYDESEGYYAVDSTLVLQLKNANSDEYLFLLGLLNSEFYQLMYSIVAQEEGRAFAQVKPNKIRALPFPEFTPAQKKEVVDLAKKLVRAEDVGIQRKLNATVLSLFAGKKQKRAS